MLQDPHLLRRVEILRLDLAAAAFGKGVDGGLPVKVVPLEDVERQFLVLDVRSAPEVEQGRGKRGRSWRPGEITVKLRHFHIEPKWTRDLAVIGT